MRHHPGLLATLSSIALAWCACAFALNPSVDISQYAHTSWRVRDGFGRGAIDAIAQTPDGYLWLGTEFGLLRFDGVRTVSWQPPPGQSLPSNSVTGLLVTRDGTLWIGTKKGLASWKDGKLTRYPELAGLLVFALLEDHEGTVWAGGYAYNPPGKLCAIQKGIVQCYGDDSSLGNGVVGLYEDRRNNLWVGVNDGLWRWRPGPPKFYPLTDKPYGVQALGEDPDGALLIGMGGRVVRFLDGKTQTAYRFSGALRQSYSWELLRDRDGGLWIGTTKGLVHIHQGRTDIFTQSDGLSADVVEAIFEDREGDIWVATIGGLDRFRNYAATTYSAYEGLTRTLEGSVLAARDKSIWLGAGDFLGKWNNGQVTIYHAPGTRAGDIPARDGGRVREVTIRGLPKDLTVLSLFQDDRGRIWIAASGGFGYLENERFIAVDGVPGGTVYSMAGDSRGNLWVANFDRGLFHLFQGKLVQHFPWAALGRQHYASALAADPSRSGLWLGGFGKTGVAYFADGRIRASYTTRDGLGQGRINSLRLDPNGTLWASTEGGLSRVKDGRVATLTSRNGLPCDDIHWSIEDDDHSVWLYTACGLVRIVHPQLEAWVADPNRTILTAVFDSANGVVTSAYQGVSSSPVAKSSDGKLWFTTWDGLSVLNPHHIPFNKLPPPVHIEKIIADGKSYEMASDANENVRLPPHIRDLEIDYTALSLVAPEKVLFRYKLEGWDREWLNAGTRRQAFFTNLSPGSYRFRVVACNNSGVWNKTGASLDFSIAPAYYQTNWFRVSCAAAFLLLLWAVYQFRVRQLQRQLSIVLEARIDERTRIARELHDTLLQSFNGALIRFLAVSNLLPARPDDAKQRIDSAIEQASDAITEGRDAVHALRSGGLATADLAQAISDFGKELLSNSTTETPPEFRVQVEGTPRDLNPMVRDEAYRIAAEALRNAVRHARARRIEVEIRYGEEQLRLRIRDDGKGMEASLVDHGRAPGHWGLRGMRERATLVGGVFEVWSELESGTEVELSIPAASAYAKSPASRWSGFSSIWRS